MMVKRMASSVLCFEVIVIGFFGLVAMKLSDLGAGTVWAVCGPAMAVAVLLCGMLRKSWAYGVGWALQIALIAGGLVVTDMYFVGAVFAAIWWGALKAGRRIDAEKAAAYAAYEAAQASQG
jgi:hypothetical protein